MERGSEVVVITGASGGIGRATARRFASEKARVALIARGHEGLQATAEEVADLGGEPLPIAIDVAHADQVEAAADEIESRLGEIDIWINGAMTTCFGRIVDMEPEEYRRVTDVTYHGAVWGTRAALRHMIPRDRGTIVQVGSALAYRAIPLQSAYCGAKHAIRAFTDSLRSELLHDRHNIYLSMVHLPGVNTPQFRWCRNKMQYEPQPMPPIFQPEICADAIYYAAHHRRREVYVGRPTVQTVFGEKVAPGLVDRYLARSAFEAQQVRGAPYRDRPDNLFEPVPGDRGAHGPYDQRARKRDALSKATVRLGAGGTRAVAGLVSLGALGALSAALSALARRGRGRRAAPRLPGRR